MKIRYYLRGLGLGILFTAIFFLVSNNSSSQTMSDEQVKARAKELGMIESTVLAELSTQEAVEETVAETVEEDNVAEESAAAEESVVEETEIEETTEEVTSEEAEEEESVVASTETDVEAEVNEPLQEAPNTAPITVVVNRGEGSDTVSRRLVELGLVADAHEYDRYLMANGYDKRIGAGEHVIPAGATWEEIAKILCNQM